MCPLEARIDTEDFDGGRCGIGPPSSCDACGGLYIVASSVISCLEDGTIPKMASEKLQKAKKIILADERAETARNGVLNAGGTEEDAAEAANVAG